MIKIKEFLRGKAPFIAVLAFCLAFFLLLHVAEDSAQKATCNRCKASGFVGANFCSVCGWDKDMVFEASDPDSPEHYGLMVCLNCDKEWHPKYGVFCSDCGEMGLPSVKVSENQ